MSDTVSSTMDEHNKNERQGETKEAGLESRIMNYFETYPPAGPYRPQQQKPYIAPDYNYPNNDHVYPTNVLQHHSLQSPDNYYPQHDHNYFPHEQYPSHGSHSKPSEENDLLFLFPAEIAMLSSSPSYAALGPRISDDETQNSDMLGHHPSSEQGTPQHENSELGPDTINSERVGRTRAK